MSISMNRYNGAQATPLDDARLSEKILGNGILTGCTLSHLGTNQVRITAGAGILEGRDYEVAQETLLVALATSGNMPGRIYVRCNLADTVTPIKFMSVCATTLPALVQSATFNESNGIWEEELATYTASTTVISALTTTYKTIDRMGATQKNITWGSGNTPLTQLCYKEGNKIYFDFRYDSNKSFASNTVIGTVPVECRPSIATGLRYGGSYRMDATTNAVIREFAIEVATNGNITIANWAGAVMYGAQGSIVYFK